MTVTIRPATERDVSFLAEIERAAGWLFLGAGMPEIADDDPIPEDELRQAMHAGLLLVADPDGEDGQPVAYLLAQTLRDSLHIEQVTVHPTHAGQESARD